jgi:tetratricopeptide (TPR) repeat protein
MNGSLPLRFSAVCAVPALALVAGCLPAPAAADPSSTPICIAKRDRPWTAPEFIAAGNDARDRAFAHQNTRLLSPMVGSGVLEAEWTGTLREASDCYERALRVNPGSYEARLGLGTVYLMVGLRSRKDAVSNPFFVHAKQHLGRAYFLRAETTDPVYYLAVIAIAEGQFTAAQQFLAHLQRIEPRDGEVLTLAGYYAERTNNSQVARQYYLQAFHVGASANTLSFITNWLRRHP